MDCTAVPWTRVPVKPLKVGPFGAGGDTQGRSRQRTVAPITMPFSSRTHSNVFVCGSTIASAIFPMPWTMPAAHQPGPSTR